jgi:DNA polymerase-1
MVSPVAPTTVVDPLPVHGSREGRNRLGPLLSSASAEWYTPPEILGVVRECLGPIELDPCSNSHATPNVPARRHFTAAEDGLAREWPARTLFLNPPYGRTINAWVGKLLDEYAAGRVQEAMALVPARTDTAWFRPLFAFPICYIRGRLKFSGGPHPAPFPSALVYLGPHPERFRAAVAGLGSLTFPQPISLPGGREERETAQEEGPQPVRVEVAGFPTPPYRVVRTAEDLPTVLAACDESRLVGADVETLGLKAHQDRARLLQLAPDKETTVYILDLFAFDPGALAPLLDVLAEKRVVAHNAAFDVGFIAGLGFVPGEVSCTMLLSILLHGPRKPRGFHKLSRVAERELGQALPKELQTSDWSGALSAEQLEYAARDAAVLLPLYARLVEKVRAAGMARAAQIEMRCLPALVWMACVGVPFDLVGWEALAAEAGREAEGLERRLVQEAPARDGYLSTEWAWNVDSPTQMRELFRLLGVEMQSTDDDALAALDLPLAGLLREYRSAAKLASTYGPDWLKDSYHDGRLHTDWGQIGCVTGRMASGTPNLQNLPGDPRYRRCIRAPEGRVLVKADYSQIELRIAAKVTGDKAMLDAYARGEDLHTRTACRMLGKVEVSAAERKLAKPVNFGLIYGLSAGSLRRKAKAEYGLDLTAEDAERYRQAFFAGYPGVAAWHRQLRRETGPEVRTLARRRCPLPEKHFYGTRANYTVQGTGGDGIKLAMAYLWERRHQCPGVFPVLVVHDEIVVECDRGQAEAAAAWLKQAMIDGMAPLITPVPVEVEVTVAQTWGG